MHLLYSPDIAYFGEEHLPYAILAIVVLCVFVLLPIALLFLYPFLVFRKFLSIFPGPWYILDTFVDSFHGCYKDGTELGTRDYRWFAAIFRLNMIWLLFVKDHTVATNIIVGIFILQTTLTAAVQPYKSYVTHYNVVNVVFLLFLTLSTISFFGGDLLTSNVPTIDLISSIVCGAIPLLYVIAISCHWIYRRRMFGSSLIASFQCLEKKLPRPSWTELRIDYPPPPPPPPTTDSNRNACTLVSFLHPPLKLHVSISHSGVTTHAAALFVFMPRICRVVVLMLFFFVVVVCFCVFLLLLQLFSYSFASTY